ncbi:MAG: Cof-type HAD-IIB family hydrolase [Verrucomicrobiota bacterium]|nr:Cof-type HAD-IIB family hydrolase [Verrucomicrobiota bacterium]
MSPKSKVQNPKSTLPIQLISTDFDGTLFAEFENPPVPLRLQKIIGELQAQGVKWLINTGRELSSLMEALGRAHLSVKPDYLVLVEREIYCHENLQYVELADWNRDCSHAHAELFLKVRADIPRLMAWVNERFSATLYEDIYSPFCLIAEKNSDADTIHEFLNQYCKTIPHLTVVRNDVYARFSHAAYNKGTALQELARRLGIHSENILAAGDHWNDLPMMLQQHAKYLIAPANAVEPVKLAVRKQNGFVSELKCGHGIADGLEFFLNEKGSKEAASRKEN